MIIAVANHKGGTGKTTTTINLGRALTLLGKKVLLIDMDPQGNLSYSLGLSALEKNVSHLMMGKAEAAEVLQESNGMFVLPSDTSLNKNASLLTGYPDSHLLLRNKIAAFRSAFDFILIDCPPSLSLYTINALNASNGVLIPLLLEVLSVQGLGQILDEIRKIGSTTNTDLFTIGALGTIVHENRKLSYEILEHIRDRYNVHVFNNHVRSNVKAAEAPSFATTVIDYAPSSASAKDYQSIANELLVLLRSIGKYEETIAN